MTVRHVAAAPTHSGGLVPIRVTDMTLAHARWWHRHVQPWIDHAKERRADQGWRWPRIYGTSNLLAGALLQRPRGLVAGITNRRSFLPTCMVFLVESYPYLPELSRQSVFLWYATRCPDAFLTAALATDSQQIPKRLMEITVDLAITHSFSLMMDGRIGLHAAPSGGDELLGKYENLGLTRLPADAPLPKGIRSARSGNDGRYFYHSEITARHASRRLDTYRERDS